MHIAQEKDQKQNMPAAHFVTLTPTYMALSSMKEAGLSAYLLATLSCWWTYAQLLQG